MKKLTIVNDAKLLELQRKSNFDIYKASMNVVIDKFTEMYPDKKGLNVLAMRSVLAGDTEIVMYKSRKFVLVLTRELAILDEMNRKTKEQNKIIIAENKKLKIDSFNRLMQDPAYRAMMTDIAKIMKEVTIR